MSSEDQIQIRDREAIQQFNSAQTSGRLDRLLHPFSELATQIQILRTYAEAGLFSEERERERRRDFEDLESACVEAYGAPPYKPGGGWAFYMTPTFSKDIELLDRKLQGRVMAALTDIFKEPCQSQGDTVKPLQDEMKGYWRYRIGDYRLIYYPDTPKRIVALISIAARSSVYGH